MGKPPASLGGDSCGDAGLIWAKGQKKTPREKEVRKPGGLLMYVSCKTRVA